LAALPWLAWVGNPYPLPSPKARADPRENPWGTPLLAAPPLAAALAVDFSRGRALSALWVTAAASLAMLFLLAEASRRAARDPRRRLRFALAWGLCVPGVAGLRAALEIGDGRAPAALARLAGASPIAWAWERATGDAGGIWDRGAIPWGGLAICVGLFAIAGVGGADRDETHP